MVGSKIYITSAKPLALPVEERLRTFVDGHPPATVAFVRSGEGEVAVIETATPGQAEKIAAALASSNVSPEPLAAVLDSTPAGSGNRVGTAFAFRSSASRNGPPRPCRAEAFWNFLGHGLCGPWCLGSVPAFLLGAARRTPRFSGQVRETLKASLLRKGEHAIASRYRLKRPQTPAAISLLFRLTSRRQIRRRDLHHIAGVIHEEDDFLPRF